MTRPRTAGDLLSQRPHTTLPADEDADEEDDDAEDDDGGDEPDYAPTGYARADDELGSLLDDARRSDLDLPTYQRFWNRLHGNVIGAAQMMWQLHGPNLDGAQRAGAIVHSGQQVGSHLTQIYAKDALGVDFTPFIPGPGIIERPGVDKLMEYSRPIREKSLGSQLRRLETLANTDLQLSKTRTLFSAFDEDQEVNRAPIRIYRRVTTSEKPCALCEIAADQVYFTTDLMPIHDNCMCDVEMSDAEDIDEHKARYHHIGFVDSLIDAGEQVKALTSLADADADADEYQNLVKIEQHGELGPVIRWAGQKYTGPGDLPVPMGVRPVPSISGPGRGHEARLRDNAARTMAVRRQRDHALHYAEGHGGITTYLPPTPKVTKPIPKPKPQKVFDLSARIAATKPIDFEHDSADNIVRAMSAKYGSRPPVSSGQVGVFGKEWNDPQYNEATKKAVLQGLDEMLTKYPQVHINRVEIEDSKGDWAGLTGYNNLTKGADYIKFDANIMRMTPEQMNQAWSRFHDRFHFPSATADPARYLVYHEFGHATDAAGGFEARAAADKTVADMFTKSGRAADFSPSDSPGKINRVILENQDAMRKWMGEQLSGYSMVDGYLPDQIDPSTGKLGRMGLARAEALAQAFSDVELRGDKASDVSRALHEHMVSETKREHVRLPAAAAATPRPAVDRLAELTEPKPNWTAEDIAKEDNHAKNAAGQVILSDEDRALARQLATDIWVAGAKVEPAISAAAVSSVQSQGGFMSGFDFRQKTGPSLYRKIQAEAIDIAKGEPMEAKYLQKAAADIKDAVRYTGVFPEEGYWDKGSQLRKALETMGAKTIKDPVGIPLDGYRGRNMAFELNGTPFEMQVHTELGVAIKDEAHHIYNDSRKLKANLEAKGLVAEHDPVYKRMLDDMQAKWDSMPMLRGTPIVQTEKDAKSGDLNKVMYTMDRTEYQGRTVPGGHASLGSAEMLARERVPSTRYGMDWLPDSPEPKIVAPARAIPDYVWDSLPVQQLPQGTHIKANEGTLKKKSIDKVVGGTEPFREGYVIKLYRTDDGALHVVDGHTRIAMYHALGKDMPVRIMDEDTLQRYSMLSPDRGAMPPAVVTVEDKHLRLQRDFKSTISELEQAGQTEENSYVRRALNAAHQGDHIFLARDAQGKAIASGVVTVEKGRDAQYSLHDFFKEKDAPAGAGTRVLQAIAQAAQRDNAELVVRGAVASARTYYEKMGAEFYTPESSIAHWTAEARDALARGAATPAAADPKALTGLTADNKGWGSVAARLPGGTEVKPVYKRGKNGKTLDAEATWAKVKDETLRENWRLALRQARPWAVAAGKDWYPGVHRLATKLSDRYAPVFENRWGVKLTPDLAASFFAAYSENNGWDGNLVGVRKFLDGTGNEYRGALKDFKYEEASDYTGIKAGKYGTRYCIPSAPPSKGQRAKLAAGKRIPMFQIPGETGWYRLYDFHVNKCLRAMQNPRGGIMDLRENDTTAPKPADFGANIAGDYERATADRWVARIILHSDDPVFTESMRGFTKTKNKVPDRIGYKRMSEALMSVSREPEFADLDGAATQAVPWVHVVGPLGSIGEIDDLSSYASVKAETLRKAAEFGDVE